MLKNNAFIGWLLIAAVFSLYLYGAGKAIYISWPANTGDAPLFNPEGLNTVISSIHALLLANFGAALGVSVVKPNSALARSFLPFRNAGQNEIVPPLTRREQIQMVATVVFLVVLIACVVTYIHKGWESKPSLLLPFVSQSAQTFIAVMLAYLAFILGKDQNQQQNPKQ